MTYIRRGQLLNELFSHAAKADNQLSSVMRYCRRRIDRTLKKLDLSAAPDVASLASDYAAKTSALDVTALANAAISAIQKAIANKDAAELLKWYDNKGVLSIACKAKGTTKVQFEQWVVRALRNGTAPAVSEALRKHLPTVQAI
jgi:hypothetical protein